MRKTKLYLIVISLLALFTLPMLIANILYKKHITLSKKTTNHGQLILPTIASTQFNLTSTGKWALILFIHNNCNKACLNHLYNLHQILKACGKDRDRIQPIIVSTAPQASYAKLKQSLLPRYPQLELTKITPTEYQKLLLSYPKLKFAQQINTVFIMDPHGNIMLAYPANSKPVFIFKDIQHLLKYSQIG